MAKVCSETWLVAAPENQAGASVDASIPISIGSSILDCPRILLDFPRTGNM